MKTILRNHSVISGKNSLEPLHTYSKFPVYIGCTNQDIKSDLFSDLSLSICKETGIIQLDKLLPLDVVYSQYHSEALGKVWRDHHLKFTKFIQKYKPNTILEIGGGNGFIGNRYLQLEPKTRWVMVEPTPGLDTKGNLEVIEEVFDDNFTFDGEIDAVVHSHLFEHMYDPRNFLGNISKLLNYGKYHIFTLPNLYKYLELKYTNWINFEHTIFLTEYFIDYLLKAYGFKIIEKSHFKDHSIFYATQRIKNNKHEPVINNKYNAYKALYLEFYNYYINTVKDFNQKIKKHSGKTYLFGAHVFSQFLLQFGINSNLIGGVIDNSDLKEGKRLYGTPLYVFKPSILKTAINPAVIVKAGQYQSEIKKQLLQIRPDVVIWE